MYKKYSEAISDKPQDSAQAYFFGCSAYEKAHDNAKETGCLKDFIKKFDKQQAAGEYVVQAYMKLAVITEKRFLFMVQQTPHFALQIMKVMAERLRRMDARL